MLVIVYIALISLCIVFASVICSKEINKKVAGTIDTAKHPCKKIVNTLAITILFIILTGLIMDLIAHKKQKTYPWYVLNYTIYKSMFIFLYSCCWILIYIAIIICYAAISMMFFAIICLLLCVTHKKKKSRRRDSQHRNANWNLNSDNINHDFRNEATDFNFNSGKNSKNSVHMTFGYANDNFEYDDN